MPDLLFAVGTRPNLIKLKPLVDAADKAGLTYTVVDTDQHYDYEMQEVFYRELALPRQKPFLPLLDPERTIVVVIGDTDSTVSSALTYSKQGFRIAHVEAGCRCGRDIPEEINRKAVDAIATWNFAPTETAASNIINGERVGDVLYDLFLKHNPILRCCPIKGLALVTIHRQENTKTPNQVYDILDSCCSDHELVLFPVHPRLEDLRDFPPSVVLLRPQSYRQMLRLIRRAEHVYTDSGGVQREAYWTGVPLTLLRNETEWPETLSPGNEEAFGDGHAADKIMQILKEALSD